MKAEDWTKTDRHGDDDEGSNDYEGDDEGDVKIWTHKTDCHNYDDDKELGGKWLKIWKIEILVKYQ